MDKRIFFLMIFTVIFFTGCSNPIASQQIEVAESYCTGRGGIESIEHDTFGFYIRCNDGKCVFEKTALRELYKSKLKD